MVHMVPVLSSERLLLKPATAADLETLYALWRMPEVLRYLFDGITMTHEQARSHLQHFLDQNDEGCGLWMIYERAGFGFVGEIGLEIPDEMVKFDPLLEGETEFQIALHPDGWGKGYGEEALTVLLAYAFDELGLPQVMGVADAPNQASRRLQEKMGFVWQREVEGDAGPLVIYKRSRDPET